MEITAKQEAQRLILAQLGQWSQEAKILDGIQDDQIDSLWEEFSDDLQDARNEVRCAGQEAPEINSRAHYSWSRNYEVEVRVIKLSGNKGLAYNFMSGGGKHGDPESYPWWDEAWFVECTGTVTIVRHTFSDIPEAKVVHEDSQ